MATKPISTEAVENGTGRSWNDWLAWLDGIGARDMSHKEIAKRVRQEGGTTGWWAQYVTVAYEQHIGRRKPGQGHRGDYQVSVTKTLQGSMDEAMAAWVRLASVADSFDGVAPSEAPRTSTTQKWRHWRIGLGDGSRVTASATARAPGRSTLTVTHDKLASQEAIERWRTFWKEFVARL